MRIAWLALLAVVPLAAWGLSDGGPRASAQTPRGVAQRPTASAGYESPRLPGPITIPGQVMVLQQAQVSALEAGMIAGLEAYEGLVVEAGQELGRLDDDRTQIEKKLAEFDREIAEKHSTDDVNVRFARAAHEVAVAELNQGHEANRKVANAVPASEIRRRGLAAERARLQIEQSERELAIAQVSSKSKGAAVDMATVNLNRRMIVAPVSGVVVDLYRHVGEWVKPGDPVLRILRIDRLKVEGNLKAGQIGNEVAGRLVTVTVALAGGRTEQFQGKIVFVSPEVEPITKDFRVVAEVINRDMLLRPGLDATLTIHPATVTARQPAEAGGPTLQR